MKKNILRVVALLLICCILVSYPLKAKASSVAFGIAGVSAISAVAAVLIGLGASPASDPSTFNSYVDRCCLDLGLGETIQGVVNLASPVKTFNVPCTLLESIRSWIFDDPSGFVTSSYGSPWIKGSCSTISQAISQVSHSPRAFVGYEGTTYCVISTPDDQYVIYDGSTLRIQGWGTSFSIYKEGSSSWSLLGSNTTYVYTDVTELVTSGTVSSTNSGIVVNDLIDVAVPTADAYPSWIEGVVHVPESVVGDDSDDGDETIPYVPTGIGETYEETIAQTKEQVQTGETTIDVTVEIPDDTVAGTKLGAFFASLVAALSWSNIKTWIEGIWTSVLSIPDKIVDLPAAIAEKFTAFWTSVTTWLEDLHAGVISLPQAIADVLADIFIPAEDYISVKVEALAVEYAFVPDIVNSVTLLKNNLVGDGGPPVIYVDFGRAGGSTNYGGKVLLTDFAWYEEYKPTVDALLSAALWAFFLWRVFLKLPGIIGGESAAVGSAFTSYTRRGRDE